MVFWYGHVTCSLLHKLPVYDKLFVHVNRGRWCYRSASVHRSIIREEAGVVISTEAE